MIGHNNEIVSQSDDYTVSLNRMPSFSKMDDSAFNPTTTNKTKDTIDDTEAINC